MDILGGFGKYLQGNLTGDYGDLFGGKSGGKSKGNQSGYNVTQATNFTPEMQKLFDSLVGSVQGGVTGGTDYLSKLASGDTSAFEEMEKPAYNAFEKQIGALGNRFSHLGALDSNYFENATAGAGRELQENLQSKRTQMRQDAIKSLMDQSNQLLNQRPFENIAEEKNKGWEDMGIQDWLTPENVQMIMKILPMLLG